MKNILIIRLSSVGDIIQTLPIAGALKQVYENETVSITWLTRRNFMPLVKASKYIDEVICIEDFYDSRFRIKKELLRIYNKHFSNNKLLFNILDSIWRGDSSNKYKKYEFIIDCQSSNESTLITRMYVSTPVYSPVVMSDEKKVYNGVTSSYFSKKFILENEEHIVDRLIKMTSKIIDKPIADVDFGYFPVDINQKNLLIKFNLLSEKYLVIVPGTQWESKNYPIESWAQVIKHCCECGYEVIVVGSKAELSIRKHLKEKYPELVYTDLIAKTSLVELMSIIANAKLVVTGDTGPLHIATAFKRPIVAIMGPTKASEFGPYYDNSIVIENKRECYGCYKTNCPFGKKCFEFIAPETINSAIDKLYSSNY